MATFRCPCGATWVGGVVSAAIVCPRCGKPVEKQPDPYLKVRSS